MTTARTIWLIWCLGWAAFWVFMAPFTFGLSLFVAAGAVVCYWLPVGKTPPSIEPGRTQLDRILADIQRDEDDRKRLGL